MPWCYFEQISNGKWKYRGPFKQKPDATIERDFAESGDKHCSAIYYSNHVGTSTTFGEVEEGFLRN